ncbi:MAG: tungstate ABC transporter substrate-binding protein WtpA [Atribacterota bacterium]
MKKSKMKKCMFTAVFALFLMGSLFMSVVASPSLDGELIIFHAGSLTVPVDNVKTAFNEIYPDIEVKTQAGGSRAIAREVAELGKPADILMSADYMVINNLLIPEHADWNAVFAVNSMVIMYTDQSKYADEINEDNWYEILVRDGVEYGHSEPDMDPCGYRSVLLFQLAEKYYQKEGINQALLDNIPQKNIRPKSVDLIAMLETGALDYAFEYESVALQHQAMDDSFQFVKLPDAINLSSLKYADDYAKATIELSGAEPGTTITTKGEPIVYSLTMPFNGENRENAIAFLQFLFDEEKGLKILYESGQPVVEVEAVSGKENVPEELADLIK